MLLARDKGAAVDVLQHASYFNLPKACCPVHFLEVPEDVMLYIFSNSLANVKEPVSQRGTVRSAL